MKRQSRDITNASTLGKNNKSADRPPVILVAGQAGRTQPAEKNSSRQASYEIPAIGMSVA